MPRLQVAMEEDDHPRGVSLPPSLAEQEQEVTDYWHRPLVQADPYSFSISALFVARGHLCREGSPGLHLLCVTNDFTRQSRVYGSALKVLTACGADEESRAAASTFLHHPFIPTMADLTDLSVAAEWVASGVGDVQVRTADGRLVRVLDTLQPAPAHADGSPSSHQRTELFTRNNHGSQCGSPTSSCPVASTADHTSLHQLSLQDGVHVVLRPKRKPEVEATGESQGKRYAVLQPCVEYEVQLLGRDAAWWRVSGALLMWSAAGSAGESDSHQRRIKVQWL